MKWFKHMRIIVPFDFSDDSVEAVKVALGIADRRDDVHVLHVVEPLPANDPYVIWDEDCDQKRKDRSRKSVEERLASLPLDEFHIDIGLGRPAKTIIELAEEIEAGLIIIPSHGTSGFKRIFIGSVAERVVRLAHCPVLVLKDADAEPAVETSPN